MKRSLTVFAILLLLFNCTGAIFGGWSLMRYPDGSDLGLSLDFLKHSPFNDYFIPGIILFAANGLLSFFAILTFVFGKKYAGLFVIIQGAVLTGWIVIQVILIKIMHPFHYILGSVGIILILIGWLLLKKKNDNHFDCKMRSSSTKAFTLW